MSLASVAIIGAGPAGLIAADYLAAAGHQITLYDQMPSVGRKLLMAGRGGLNLTNSEPLDIFLARYGDAQLWLKEAINVFSPAALKDWCQGLGEETFIGTSGRLFPKSLKASPLLRALLTKLQTQDVRFALRRKWLGWDGEGNLRFADHQGAEEKASYDATLLALGGASWPKLGSTGEWVEIFNNAEIAVSPLKPANCGVEVAWSPLFKKRFSGSPLKPIKVTFGGTSVRGDAVVTERGFEGGPFYALIPLLRESIRAFGKASISLDLQPDLSIETLLQRLSIPRRSQSFSEYLRKSCRLTPLVSHLLYEAQGIEKMRQLSTESLSMLNKNCLFDVTGTTGIERAISTAGGVTRDSFDENFMLLKKPGVFVAGEMLDWEAPTGGYLLQATLSTGVAAAQGMLRWLNNEKV